MKKHFWLYRILSIPAAVLFGILFTPRVRGTHNLPGNGGYVLAGNHTSFFDCLLVAAAVPRTIRFLAMQPLFRPPFDSFFKAVGCIPVHRNGQDTAAVRQAIRALRSNHVVCIFPEGKISKSCGCIETFHIGYGVMAAAAKAPVVPFCITGKPIPFFGRFTVTFLPPVVFEKQNIEKQNQAIVNAITCVLQSNCIGQNTVSGESI